MYKFDFAFEASSREQPDLDTAIATRSDAPFFEATKRAADIAVSLAILPVVLLVGLFLLLANPFANPGTLLFRQQRMGRDCRPFTAYKFRSMRPESEVSRRADDPLEAHRITPLGARLRRMRLDELPQIVNVLKGDMSLIGPRPDFYDHACVYVETIPGYRLRHVVRPGISGLAQTEIGYVQGIEATRRKVRADLHYIANSSLRLDAWIFWRTLVVVLRRDGA